jgi:hypothetical protein
MTLYEINQDVYYINLALRFAVTYEGYPWVYMGDPLNVYVLLGG